MEHLPGPGLLVVGTSSDAGKSFVVTGLCRLLARRGARVHPFKAVNMSLNSTAAEDGGEMALAQWVQCRAAGVPPRTVANPVLLKPEGPGRVEVIVRGRPFRRVSSWRREMPRLSATLWESIRRSLRELRQQGFWVVAEGAGSPAEPNLKATDLANFRVARELGLPVLLVADLDRGGAIAHVVGTLALLPPRDRKLIRGILLNRIRGDPRVLAGAIRFLRDRTGVPVVGSLGVLEPGRGTLPPEDSLRLPTAAVHLPTAGATELRRPTLGILKLPHASNFSDFSGFDHLSGLRAVWVDRPEPLARLDALILPGSRRTRDDLRWLEENGLFDAIWEGRERGLRIGGICGGYQMLGARLRDPHGFEGNPGTTEGLGLLPVETSFRDPKLVREVEVEPIASPPWDPGEPRWPGYEIRRGRTRRRKGARPLFRIRPRSGQNTLGQDPPSEEDGAWLPSGEVWGSSVHGLFTSPLRALGVARWAVGGRPPSSRPTIRVRSSAPRPGTGSPVGTDLERSLDAVADHLATFMTPRTLSALLEGGAT